MAGVNSFTIEQSYAMLNLLQKEALGENATVQVVDTGTFTSVATTLLQSGTDTIINALQKVLTKTMFGVRPYSAKFKGLDADAERFGMHTRKINFIDGVEETDQRQSLTDGASVDQWTVNKPKALETNLYGMHQHQRHITIFKDQLDQAFSSVGEWNSFVSNLLLSVQNQREQIKEDESRAVLINLIVGKKLGDSSNVINVLQAYKDETGTALTVGTMFADDNYTPFVKWLYSYINTLTDLMACRSELYHINVSGKPIARHTPAQNLKAYMAAAVANKIDSIALPSIFGAEKLKMIDFESVAYWQNIKKPLDVNAKCAYMGANGSITQPSTATSVTNVLGLIFDEEACGITDKGSYMQATPMNAAGGYYNIFYHDSTMSWVDFTENAVVLYAADPT